MTSTAINRRRVLRGALGSAAVTLGLPLLDCFLNTNGSALADGAPLPVCFVNWFWGLGFNPGRWEPKSIGPKYEMAPELEALTPLKDKINVYSGLMCFLDGRPVIPHGSGPQVILTGTAPLAAGRATLPSIDSLVADVIGLKTRFRSLEISCDGTSQSFSQRGGSVVNPSEVSPVALYQRIFGPDFKDPNAADFKPDPHVMLRRSMLSAVSEERQTLVSSLGVTDKARLDEYFTSVRELEHQLDLELQKPAPLEACTVPGKPDEVPPGTEIEKAISNHKLFANLIAHALACGQTRVANIMLSGAASNLRRAGSAMTFHLYTHEEPVDPATGFQPNASWFSMRSMDAFHDMLIALDGIREGDGTLLDRSLVLASTDGGFAKIHSVNNVPLLTAGRAGGRVKTGIHVRAQGDAVTRVGLTVQQALGVPISSWGTDSNHTSKTISDVLV